MKKILLILVALFVVTSCGQKAATPSYECTVQLETPEKDRTLDVKQIIEYEEDTKKVTKQTIFNTVENKDQEALDFLISQADKVSAQYKELGLDYTSSHKDLTFEETTVFDFTKLDIKKLVDAGIIQKVNGQYPDYMDIDLTIDTLEAGGFKCNKK